MKTLITGSNGQLGMSLALTAPSNAEPVGLDLPEIDVTNFDEFAAVCGDLKPAVIINAAAYTAVDRAEDEPELAKAINVEGARNVAKAARGVGARLIHISTDFVFDGMASTPYRPDAPANPLSVYGRTKRDGEIAVLETMPESAVIVRTAWLYSKFGGNFVKTMLRLMAERDELGVVADQVGTPTWAESLASALWGFAEMPNLQGIFHWTDDGVANWHEFAMAIQHEAFSLRLLEKQIPVKKLATKDYPTKARRPRYSVLDCSTACKTLGMNPKPWRVNLMAMLEGIT